MITTPVNSHKVGIMILYSVFQSELNLQSSNFREALAGIFIATSDSSLPKVYVLIHS